jgi:hypothetical protein
MGARFLPIYQVYTNSIVFGLFIYLQIMLLLAS